MRRYFGCGHANTGHETTLAHPFPRICRRLSPVAHERLCFAWTVSTFPRFSGSDLRTTYSSGFVLFVPPENTQIPFDVAPAKSCPAHDLCPGFLRVTCIICKVKFIEQHGEVSDATAAFVRFAIAAGASLPFADLREGEVLFAGATRLWWKAL